MELKGRLLPPIDFKLGAPAPSAPLARSVSSQVLTTRRQQQQQWREQQHPHRAPQRQLRAEHKLTHAVSAHELERHRRRLLHRRGRAFELALPHCDARAGAMPPLVVQDIGAPASAAAPAAAPAAGAESRRASHAKRLKSALEEASAVPPTSADAIRACHEVVYAKLAVLDEALCARDGRAIAEVGDLAAAHLAQRDGPSKRIRGGVDELRALCEQTAHPMTRLFARLIGWPPRDAPLPGGVTQLGADDGHAAAWLLLGLLLPPHDALYPPDAPSERAAVPVPQLAPSWALGARSAAAGQPHLGKAHVEWTVETPAGGRARRPSREAADEHFAGADDAAAWPPRMLLAADEVSEAGASAADCNVGC